MVKVAQVRLQASQEVGHREARGFAVTDSDVPRAPAEPAAFLTAADQRRHRRKLRQIGGGFRVLGRAGTVKKRVRYTAPRKIRPARTAQGTDRRCGTCGARGGLMKADSRGGD